jgi:serine/threonine protein kinase
LTPEDNSHCILPQFVFQKFATPLPLPHVIGSMLGHYQVVALLGAGGMGEVYRARDVKLGREVHLQEVQP